MDWIWRNKVLRDGFNPEFVKNKWVFFFPVAYSEKILMNRIRTWANALDFSVILNWTDKQRFVKLFLGEGKVYGLLFSYPMVLCISRNVLVFEEVIEEDIGWKQLVPISVKLPNGLFVGGSVLIFFMECYFDLRICKEMFLRLLYDVSYKFFFHFFN